MGESLAEWYAGFLARKKAGRRRSAPRGSTCSGKPAARKPRQSSNGVPRGFTAAMCRRAAKRYSENATCYDLALIFGVSRSVIVKAVIAGGGKLRPRGKRRPIIGKAATPEAALS